MARDRDDEIVRAYRVWDPDAESVDELAERLGTTRATLYNVLHRNDEPLKTRRRRGTTLEETKVDPTVDWLLTRLVQAETELAALRDENAKLLSWVEEFAAKLDDAGIQHNHVGGGRS